MTPRVSVDSGVVALLSQDEIVLTSPGDEADAPWFAGFGDSFLNFPFFSVKRNLKCLGWLDEKERRSLTARNTFYSRKVY